MAFLEQKIEELTMQLQVNKSDLNDKDQLIVEERKKMIEVVKDHNLDLDKEKEDYQAQINIANLERNTLKDEKFKVDEKIDQLQEQIKRLEKNLQLASDEVNLRKTINDSMGENLMKHESESMQMAQKLALMKNQIMEYDKHVGLNRKFGAVKQGQIKAQACTVSHHPYFTILLNVPICYFINSSFNPLFQILIFMKFIYLYHIDI